MSNIAFIVPKLRDNGAWLDWRGQYPGGLGWRYDRSLSTIKYAANHHSVTNPTGNAKADVDTLWNIHRANGWGGIGYNFAITSEEVTGSDGLRYAKVAYVGDLGSVRAHTPNTKGAGGLRAGYGNEDIVAACMIGQLHLTNPTEAQIRSAYWLYRELIQEEPERLPNLRGDINGKLHGHQTFDATACPGNWGWQKNAIVGYQDPPKVEVRDEVRLATIVFGKRTAEDPNYPAGQTRVEPGADGEKKVFWRVTFTNGQETKREITGEEVVRAAVDEVTYTGTWVEPTPEPEPEPEPPVEPEPPIEPPVNPPLDPELGKSVIDILVKWVLEVFNAIKKIFKRN